jgi:hypothetical protein
MNKHMKIVIAQIAFIALALAIVYFLYPKVDARVTGNAVSFSSENTEVVMISQNPDFSNPMYVEIGNGKNLSVNLKPGAYYWKPSNSFISGMRGEFVIESEVGLGVSNDSELVNIGNVKVNVTKSKEGVMVGHIILEPDEKEKIAEGEYTGRQEK